MNSILDSADVSLLVYHVAVEARSRGSVRSNVHGTSRIGAVKNGVVA